MTPNEAAKRIGWGVAGLALLGVLIGLGVAAVHFGSWWIIVFGVACALAPTPLFGAVSRMFTLTSDRILLAKLAKVPQIDEMIATASTVEERLRLLRAEREALADTVHREAARLALDKRRQDLDGRASGIVAEYGALEAELRQIEGSAANVASEAVQQLEQRIAARSKGQRFLTIGKSQFEYDPSDLIDPNRAPILLVQLALASAQEVFKRLRHQQPNNHG